MSDKDYLINWLHVVLDGKSARTIEGYEHVVRRLFNFLEENDYPTELRRLKPINLRGFFSTVRSAGSSPNTLANFDRTLRAIFARIEREGRDDFDLPKAWQNPLAQIEKNKPRKEKKNPLSKEQARLLLNNMPRKGFIAYRNYAEVAFMLMSGARSIEVRHVRIPDLNLENGIAVLKVTKGDKPRIVYLPSKLIRIVSNYLHKRRDISGSLLFPTKEGRLQSRRSIHRTVQRAGQRSKLVNLSPHKLRHSYVTLSHAKGAPLKFLQEQCGHSSILVTEGYIHLSGEQKAEIAEAFAAI